MKGRVWKSHSFPSLKPYSMSQARARPDESRDGSSRSRITLAVRISSSSSSSVSTYSLRVDATSSLPPSALSRRRHGDLNIVRSSTPSGDQRSVSAGVPSTAPPTPSEVATSMRDSSPVWTSAVTSTPDFSLGTLSRMTTDGSTQSGSSISVCRQEKER